MENNESEAMASSLKAVAEVCAADYHARRGFAQVVRYPSIAKQELQEAIEEIDHARQTLQKLSEMLDDRARSLSTKP